MKRTACCALIGIFLLLNGCGYQLVTGRGIYGGDITSIDVPVFKNRTYEPQVPGFFTDAFSRELASSGLFDLNRPGTDATLQGTVNRVFSSPSSISGQGLALEKVVTIDISLVLTREGNAIRNWNFVDAEAYQVNDINLEDFNKREAMQRIAARMSRRLLAQMMGVY